MVSVLEGNSLVCLQVLGDTTVSVKKSCIKLFVAPEGAVTQVTSLESPFVGAEDYKFHKETRPLEPAPLLCLKVH